MFLTTGPLLIQDVAAAVTDVTISILAVGAVVLIALIVVATTRPVKNPCSGVRQAPLIFFRVCLSES